MLRGAIIGFGEVARYGHAPAYAASSEAKIVAVVDPSKERRELARESITGVATFSTIDALAAGIKIDFVDICTPPAWHGEPMLKALAHGWNVLCEKPLLLDLIELEKARNLARQTSRVIVPVHNWKYAPIVRRATELLRSGIIGKLRTVEIRTLRTQDCSVADPDHPSWRRSPKIAGGGILMDHGWHAIYLARHWFEQEPVEVAESLHRPRPDAVEDEATLNLVFPAGYAKIFLSWKSQIRRNTMCLTGELGEITVDDDTLTVGSQSTHFETPLSAGSHHPDWFAAMLPDITANFRHPAAATESFEEAALCLSVIRRAYK